MHATTFRFTVRAPHLGLLSIRAGTYADAARLAARRRYRGAEVEPVADKPVLPYGRYYLAVLPNGTRTDPFYVAQEH